VEISPKGFTLGVKVEREKNFSICPKLLINAELYGLVLVPKAGKKIPSNLGGQFATPKLAPSFFGLDSQCKAGLRGSPHGYIKNPGNGKKI
jgi:hypothetical protein